MPQIMQSIKIQLEWLVSFFKDKSTDRNKLHDLLFGCYSKITKGKICNAKQPSNSKLEAAVKSAPNSSAISRLME